MKLIKVNENLLVNPDRIDFIEQRGGEIRISVDNKIFKVERLQDLQGLMKEIFDSGSNLWGSQHFKG
jgi:hypothetical protein